MADKAILYDATRCTACRGCQAACKQWNENDEYIPPPSDKKGVEAKNRGSYENPPDLSPQTWLKMRFTEVERDGEVRWLFTRQACMHCTDAACVRVCPNGTLYHHELGFVAYNKDTCTGCGY
jgi:formate dehydrogenase iron-sulfur subunit